jgi:hypothetical protein
LDEWEEERFKANRLERLREMVEELPLEVFPDCYTDYDRDLLGLKEEECDE